MKDLSDVLSFNVVEQSQRQVICVCGSLSATAHRLGVEGGHEDGIWLCEPHGCAYLYPAHEGMMDRALKSSKTAIWGNNSINNELFCVQIQDGGNASSSTSESSVTVELSKETLDTMLDGLGRIRDQLSAVAGK